MDLEGYAKIALRRGLATEEIELTLAERILEYETFLGIQRCVSLERSLRKRNGPSATENFPE